MDASSNPSRAKAGVPAEERLRPPAESPQLTSTVVLSLLEADQVVAAKQQSRFGARNLSLGFRAILWGLRVYVVIMLVIVLISVVRATHGTP